MTTFFTCTMFCLPKQPSTMTSTEEPNAFDLTWRNYLPSTSQLCPCLPNYQRQAIQLNDDHYLPTPSNYYNDFYNRDAVRGYIDNPNDREFDDLLSSSGYHQHHQKKKKKKRSKSKKKQYQKQYLNENDYDEEEEEDDDDHHYYSQQEPIVYEVYSDDDHRDAEFLADDQIAKMVNQGTVIHEQHNKEFYAARTIPFVINNEYDDSFDQEEIYHDEPSTSNNNPKRLSAQTAALAAQAIFSETIDGLSEKLAIIRHNMKDIGSTSKKTNNNNNNSDDDDQDDTATLHTLKTIKKKNSQSSIRSSDLDSIASEALNEYENTTKIYQQNENEQSSSNNNNKNNRRFSSNVTSDLRMPVIDTYSSSNHHNHQHPFSFFTEPEQLQNDEDDHSESNASENKNSRFQDVLKFGKKWLG